MPIQGITSKIVSTLGNKESLIPIMIKDGVDSGSLTYNSYKAGGKIEGRDRAIDEFGTQAIWIGGIPFYKKLIDCTIYKGAKLNPGVDIRVVTNPEYAQWAKENAKGMMQNDGVLSKVKFLQPKPETVKDAVTNSLKNNGSNAKSLYIAKVAASTALTLATFFALTKGKQKKTKDSVIEEMNNEVKNTTDTQGVNVYSTFVNDKNNPIFDDFTSFTSKEKSSPAFKGGLKSLSDAILFNPVHNMKIIDAGITAERIGCSRNKTEFMEHTIKEGGFLFFLYCFGDLLEKGINKFSSKYLNAPIDMAIDVITDNKLTEALKNGKIASDVAKLPKEGKLTDKLNFVLNNPDNILVQAAKKSNIVSETVDAAGKAVVDTSKFIDMQKLETLAGNLTTVEEKFAQSGLGADKFVNKMKGMKMASVGANIAASCLFLGYLIPKAVYKYREFKTGTKDFHVANDIKNNNTPQKELKK